MCDRPTRIIAGHYYLTLIFDLRVSRLPDNDCSLSRANEQSQRTRW
jgi:hypothetical protein